MKNEMKTKVMIAGAAFCAALFLCLRAMGAL